jgi:hypothetical protein
MSPVARRRKVNPFTVGLVASYCASCGLLIAASTRRKSLDLMEKVHQCPVYFHYPQTSDGADGVDAWPSPAAKPRSRFLVYLE